MSDAEPRSTMNRFYKWIWVPLLAPVIIIAGQWLITRNRSNAPPEKALPAATQPEASAHKQPEVGKPADDRKTHILDE